jgi:hypothetical protein
MLRQQIGEGLVCALLQILAAVPTSAQVKGTA